MPKLYNTSPSIIGQELIKNKIHDNEINILKCKQYAMINGNPKNTNYSIA
jgi:hypothetical protein